MRDMVLTAGMPFPMGKEGEPLHLASLGDEMLMERYRDGDHDAFEVLYRRHRASLHRFIHRLAPAESDVLFQEVWLAVIGARHRYQPSAKFSTYLFSITHNKAVTRLRTLKRSLEDAMDENVVQDVAAPENNPFDSLQNAELGQALLSAIGSLPLVQREAFLLQAETGLSIDDIANVTGAFPETVKSRLRYASKFLRKALEDWR